MEDRGGKEVRKDVFFKEEEERERMEVYTFRQVVEMGKEMENQNKKEEEDIEV